MSEQENVALIQRFCDSWSDYDIDAILEYFTDDAIYHNMPIQPVQGKDAIKGMIEQFMSAFTGSEWIVKHISAAGDAVLTERVDKFIGDKSMALQVMGVFEIKDGKIAAWRDYFDLAEWTNQMA